MNLHIHWVRADQNLPTLAEHNIWAWVDGIKLGGSTQGSGSTC